jgi:prevent-host-death family protein
LAADDKHIVHHSAPGPDARVILHATIGLTNWIDEPTMKEVAVYEAKTRLSELLVEVEQGEQITITRRGLPVARLVAAGAARRGATSQRQQVAGTIAKLRAERIVLEGRLKDWIAEGRD